MMNTVLKIMAALFALTFSCSGFARSSTPLPENLETLVNLSDTAVIGTLEGIKDSNIFYGYQNNANQLKQLNENAGVNFGIPVTDYIIKVKQVLKVPPTGFDGKQLLIRMLPNFVQDVAAANETIKKKAKKKQVFFLRLNPDGKTYGVFTTMSIMDFKSQNGSKERLVFHEEGREHIPFGVDEPAVLTLQRIESLVRSGVPLEGR